MVCRIAAKENDGSRELLDAWENAVVSAVGEAFNNVVMHAYRGRGDGVVTLVVDCSEDELVVELRHDGAGFELAAVPEPRLDDLPESGMGVFIIRACMDELSYHPGSPNILRMRKRLPQRADTARTGLGLV
jgi:serine/threonine-protein kinase RsbW